VLTVPIKFNFEVNLSWSVDPCQVREMRIGGNADNLSIQILELLDSITEGNYFSGTHKGAAENLSIKMRSAAIKILKITSQEGRKRALSIFP